jgi:D-aminopeptidase
MTAQPIRARDLGVPFGGAPGRWNAITDVPGVEVGHTTLILGDGPLRVGEGPVRTGVTAVLPRGKQSRDAVFAGWTALNGNGEMTGTAWIDESGLLDGPVLITNTASVGAVRDAAVAWGVRNGRYADSWALPVVAETYDGFLNDINGFHVREEHVFAALDGASGGPVAEGSVGGGTGMVCFQFKGGIGTASRVVELGGGSGIVGALVQANFGLRRQLTIAGAPVGAELAGEGLPEREAGSIIVVVATDIPMLPHQLRAVARRAGLGVARTGGIAGISSGDIFLAFSTGNLEGSNPRQDVGVTMLGLASIDAVFEATVQAVEEAIVNALVAGRTMTGVNGRTVHGLPHDALRQALGKYNLLAAPRG